VQSIRVATWNIHKGVNGLGPRRRLEIHNIGLAIDQFDADIICLQEVRKHHRGEAQRFAHWPSLEQADFLAPLGYTPVYQTNAITKHGEHGNALLTRWPVIKHQHEDMSDHRFEQRGLLHVEVLIHEAPVHIVVVHLGLIQSSRRRQVKQLCDYIQREIPKNSPLIVAGDFNDWGSACEELSNQNIYTLIKPTQSLQRSYEHTLRDCLWCNLIMFLRDTSARHLPQFLRVSSGRVCQTTCR
jgi:endonuclease/exonuclease/phosphatase family metal-dependent hydrolase